VIPDVAQVTAAMEAAPVEGRAALAPLLSEQPVDRRLLPDNAEVGSDGRLAVGGCALDELAREFGTPLFVYDEAHLRARCREAVEVFGDGVAYATKAFLCLAMARLAHEEGMHLDVATGGELHVALTAGVPADRLVLHGNNKSEAELVRAREAGVGRTVVDSFDELDRLERLHAADGRVPRVLVRATPGVEAHTHEFIRTGQLDSKFGFGVASGALATAVERCRASRAVDLVGVHLHIGSQVFVADFFHQALDVVAPWVRDLALAELSVGGGLGVPYVAGEEAPSITEWGRTILSACADAGIESRVTAEPGRAIAARAAVTLYRVGTVKDIPGVRTYVSVDGGMSDNPRPVLYGSGYEAFLPRATEVPRPRAVTVVGKHCESGDVLVRDARVPADVAVGDLLATPVTGAYGHSMGSNYNKVTRPAIVFARDGDARLVVRRETEDDLLRYDLP
jgi:diaminopimelate decarboxylase